ncbi:P-loop containing nucleoside triphosphate hydrolase protein [Stachybotrys elegans]|uniref:P-loop containing nucleoside triphosphate hydrolase protein n=1 Tax=Stachybotrys elegans TaxID=80388 RepID=A0A8K0WS93_9HYPO|nr:P-loop containing nucleoside triphosphate hydrolase protein [Stachybotrys elegans]
MVLTKLGPTVLDGLLSSKHHEILDLIDSLRSQGIDREVDLPQIIVCGDQSSGKSSVLEAISGVPFPVKSNLCTRFPTELVLRKTPQTGVKISIIPHHSRSKSESDSLTNFNETLDDIEHLPRLIEAAKTAMGIVTLGTAFSRDILRIEVSGPDRPALTIVDLPGLIHSENKNQTAEDVKLINEVVQSYMQESRTIILSVVSAKNDYANQIVLKLARQADPRGSRTMGVITKPDTLLPGSESESGYISLAKNEDIEFRLGWHVLRNADSEAVKWSLVQRDAEEAKFFSGGSWQRLPPTCLGIDNLRTRLSSALYYQIETELPSLVDDIKSKLMLYQEELLKLGNPRVTLDDQRYYLFQISQTFQNLAKAATDGTYNHEFFGDAMTAKGRTKRFRAVVQELGEGFARKIYDKGHSHGVLLKNESSYTLVDQAAHNLLRYKVVRLMARTRGRELPGMFNPMVVTDLFQEMCSPWEDIAVSHVKEVFNAARVFLTQVFDHICDKPSAQAIIGLIAEPKLDDILKHQREKTMALLKPHQQGHPITYHQLLLQRVQEIRQERDEDAISKVMARFYGSQWKTVGREYCSADPVTLYNELTKARKTADAKNDVASKALDYVRVYYEVRRTLKLQTMLTNPLDI